MTIILNECPLKYMYDNMLKRQLIQKNVRKILSVNTDENTKTKGPEPLDPYYKNNTTVNNSNETLT